MSDSSKNFNFKALSFLRVCVHCGAYRASLSADQVGQPRQLCIVCAQRLQRYFNETATLGYEFAVYSLLNWGQESDVLIRSLIMGLKGGGPNELFEYFALRMSEQRLRAGALNRNVQWCVVPAARERQEPDHAGVLALQIGTTLKLPVWPLLRRKNHDKQKRRNAKERKLQLQEVELQKPSSSGTTEFSNQLGVIFVDDVITTGETARAAFLALGRPKAFEVWTLAHRPRKF